jgi:hypothetical protein
MGGDVTKAVADEFVRLERAGGATVQGIAKATGLRADEVRATVARLGLNQGDDGAIYWQADKVGIIERLTGVKLD